VQVVAIGVFNICVTAYAFVQIRQLSILRNCGELFVTAAEEAAQDLALASWNILVLVVGTDSRSWYGILFSLDIWKDLLRSK
jgi:hypothetical protein